MLKLLEDGYFSEPLKRCLGTSHHKSELVHLGGANYFIIDKLLALKFIPFRANGNDNLFI